MMTRKFIDSLMAFFAAEKDLVTPELLSYILPGYFLPCQRKN
ncbi:MAG TPA: hypothetical protein VKM55_21580 [Candidatus Lokiarchaeia archaeon]|nr:hypothetical protein [Candidatus Lokiarchaeia archaeon]